MCQSYVMRTGKVGDSPNDLQGLVIVSCNEAGLRCCEGAWLADSGGECQILR